MRIMKRFLLSVILVILAGCVFFLNFGKSKDLERKLPDVSVIIPIYNGEKYIPKTLKSMINQTHKNIEIICIDDGSTDKTMALLNEYAKRHKNIRVFSQENQGVGKTRNRGLVLARGKYVIFLDVDDEFDKNMLKVMYERAEEFNSDIVVCNSITAWSNTLINYKMTPIKFAFNMNDIPDTIFNFNMGGQVWDKLYKKKFLVENQIVFPDLKNTEDLYFNYVALALAPRISIVYEHFVKYYVTNPNSVSSRKNEEPLCTLQALILLKKKLEELGVYDKVERSYINMFVESLFDCYVHVDKNSKDMIMKELVKVLPSLKIDDKRVYYFYNAVIYKEFIEAVDKYTGRYNLAN